MKYYRSRKSQKKWVLSDWTARNYCAAGKIPEVFLTGKTWNIPENASRPKRSNKHTDELKTPLDHLRRKKASKATGCIYHKAQIELTYNSNHIEGSRLTHDKPAISVKRIPSVPAISEWKSERDFLTDTCLAAQDKFKKYLDYFRIGY